MKKYEYQAIFQRVIRNGKKKIVTILRIPLPVDPTASLGAQLLDASVACNHLTVPKGFKPKGLDKIEKVINDD